MTREVAERYPTLLILRHGLGVFLLVCCIFIASGASLTVAPSATTTQAPPTTTPTTTTIATTSSRFPSLPIQSPLPLHSTCQTGPEFVDKVSGRITETDHVYLDLSQPVNCSGVITRWYYCHIVIAFRNTPSELWPCVWRQSSHLEGYETIGCNKFKIIPGDGDTIRCRLYVPPNPSDLLRVKEGDYIGFYVPDSGIILALSPASDDIGHYQLRSNKTGFSSFVADSELVRVSSEPGRALLRAEIDSDWVFPSIVPILPTFTPPATAGRATKPTAAPTGTVNIGLAIGLVIAVGVTLVLIITVIALVAYVNYKSKRLSGYNRFSSGSNEMKYNDMYKFRIANHVVVGNQRTFVEFDQNPAYNSMCSTKIQTGGSEEEAASSANRRQLEHTYESLSNFHVNVVK